MIPNRENDTAIRRYGDTACANAGDPHGVSQRRDHMDYKCKPAYDQKLSVHAAAARLARPSVYPGTLAALWPESTTCSSRAMMEPN